MAVQQCLGDAGASRRRLHLSVCVILSMFIVGEVWAQTKLSGMVATAPDPICVLEHVPSDTRSRFVPPPTSSKSGALTSTITVTYVGVSDTWPISAMTAFDYAKGLWEQTLTSSQTIRVEAKWDSLSACIGGPVSLGSARGNRIWRNVAGLPADTWHVDALADKLTGMDLNGGDFDILASFNSECDEPGANPDWYYGTDGMPGVGQVDFASVVLHELGHGLGFAGAGRVTGGTGTVRFSSMGMADPYSYDTFTQDGQVSPVLLVNYADPSASLKDALEGQQGGGVFFNGTNANAANFGQPPRLYSPAAWQQGSSYSHLDETTFNGTTNALMTPQLGSMEAQHVIGGITCGMFEDQGWTIAVGDCDMALPVELVSLDAIVSGSRVSLRWVTATERNSAAFEVQHSAPFGSYRAVSTVDAAGTSDAERQYAVGLDNLEPGIHHFRLRQIDLDGSSTFSAEIAATIAVDAAYSLTEAFPNPFVASTELVLAARTTQHVRVDVYDALGRRVAVLYEGPLMDGESRRMTLEGVQLAAGLYVVRAAGETFSASRTVVRAR